ncbi:MAG: CoA transferase [SAR324 cluster bacterium]|nr:CoA transferase [SAR324 cluster bacterium]
MSNLPLAGYRVVDFGWVWAGTLLGSILGSYGAEVIKMESRRRIDGLRLGKVFKLGDELEKNPYFLNLNRNKLSTRINMAHEEGARLIRELVKKSDIVIENFTPGTLKKRGLDYESLAEVKPDIIMLSLSPMGQQGPLANLVTYAPVISALSGIDSMVGYPGENPIGFKHAYADVVASMSGLFSILAAVRHHAQTGQGQYIDLSQGEAVMPFMGEAFLASEMNNNVMGPQGNTSRTMAPHGVYPCIGDDKWVSIAVKTEEEWCSFCGVLGDPEWTKEDKFCTTAQRIAHVVELDEHVAAWTKNHDKYEITELLQKAGVAAAPMLDSSEILSDPHLKEREVFVDGEHPVVDKTVLYNWPWKMNGVDSRMQRAPLFGEHSEYVFSEILGFSQEEIENLKEQEVIY